MAKNTKKGGTKGAANTETEGTTTTEGTEATPAKKPIQMNSVGPKRRLAFALVGVLSLIGKAIEAGEPLTQETLDADPNYAEARKALTDTGYAELKPRAEREAELKRLIGEAAAEGNSTEVLALAKRLKAVQDGRPEPGTKEAAEDEAEG